MLPAYTNPSYDVFAIHINDEHPKETLDSILVCPFPKQYDRYSRIRKSWWRKSTRSH